MGRALVRGDPAGAVELYLTRITAGESAEGRAARADYAAHHDPRRALAEFPPAYRFERSLLDHLARGSGPIRAFGALPRELRRLFVHAYQSWLFNRYLSRRWGWGADWWVPEIGDRLVRRARDGTLPGAAPIPIGADNLAEARQLVDRGRAELAGPLLGRATPSLEGRPGELVEGILAEEGLHREGFRLMQQPELASEGTWRPLSVPVPPIALLPPEPSGARPADRASYRLLFALPKGCYATVLLREILKDGATAAVPAVGGLVSNQA